MSAKGIHIITTGIKTKRGPIPAVPTIRGTRMNCIECLEYRCSESRVPLKTLLNKKSPDRPKPHFMSLLSIDAKQLLFAINYQRL